MKIDVIPNRLEKYMAFFLKQKDAYPYEYMDSFKRFSEGKLPDKKFFYSSIKDGTTGDNGEKLDSHWRLSDVQKI